MTESASRGLEAFPSDLYRAHAWYNARMNERLYDAAARLSDEQRKRDMGAFFASIHLTLNHLLIADRVWLARFGCAPSVWQTLDEAGAPIHVREFAQDVYPRFERLRAERARTDRDIEDFVRDLSPTVLAGTLEYRTSGGEDCRHPMWWALSHFFNHQTHHRGQVTTLLKQAGVDPGVTDLVILLREEQRGAA
jgi:uncharacterized damage-inducible protein DinB